MPGYGEGNTAAVMDVVRERLGEGGIEALVVASTRGRTARDMASKVGPETDLPVICISDPAWAKYYPGITPENRQALEELQVEIVDYVPYASHSHSIGRCKNMCGAPDLRVMFFDAFRLTGEIELEASDGGTYDGHRWGEDNRGGGYPVCGRYRHWCRLRDSGESGFLR